MPAIIANVALIVLFICLNFVIWFIAKKEGLILVTMIFGITFFIDIYTLVVAIHDYRAYRRHEYL